MNTFLIIIGPLLLVAVIFGTVHVLNRRSERRTWSKATIQAHRAIYGRDPE